MAYVINLDFTTLCNWNNNVTTLRLVNVTWIVWVDVDMNGLITLLCKYGNCSPTSTVNMAQLQVDIGRDMSWWICPSYSQR